MEEKTKKPGVRKDNIKRGQRTQKMMSFRIDDEVQDILNKVTNKGRLINDLIKEWWKSRNIEEHDYSPEENEVPLEDET